jgi:V/A-type H+-transporting ATPase subunit C
MSAAYDYGNARIRALKSALLSGTRYRELMDLDLDGLLAALGDTPYQPDVLAATPRHEGVRLVYEALRLNLSRTLVQMAAWYEGEAAEAIALLLGRWDLRNLRAVLRGQFARRPLDEIEAILVPAGTVTESILTELATQADLRTTIEMMMVWGVPDAKTARAVLAAWPEFEASGDFQALERVLERSRSEYVAAAVDRHDPTLAAVLKAEVDQVNILTMLRLLDQGEGPWDAVDPIERLLSGGAIPIPTLLRASAADDRAAATAELGAAARPWLPALSRWAESGDLVGLAGDLEAKTTTAAASLFSTSDPLGLGTPIAYVWAKENEVRNLRTIAAGLDAGLPPELIETELVVLW